MKRAKDETSPVHDGAESAEDEGHSPPTKRRKKEEEKKELPSTSADAGERLIVSCREEIDGSSLVKFHNCYLLLMNKVLTMHIHSMYTYMYKGEGF